MKNIRKRQKGFAVIEIIIIIVAIVILAAVGWVAYDRFINKSDETSETTNSTEILSDETINNEVPEAKNVSDLKNLDTQLNNANLGDTNVSDLNSQLDF